jgi:glycosyltransferase involved in cell wall biosynthesis
MKIPLVVDRHTTFLLNKKDWGFIKLFIFRILHRFTIKYADITIVTNNYLSTLVRELGGKPFVLPDMIPELKYTRKEVLKGNFNILLISSFASDEPIVEILEAARLFEKEDIKIYITGNFKKLDKHLLQSAPSNVIFTGFLDEQDYINMLFSVDVIMVLTTSDACMLCGCYEAISAGKPLITSDKDVLTDYFTDAVFVNNSAGGIAEGIRKVFERRSDYQDRIMKLKTRLVPEWEERYDNLEGMIHALIRTHNN